MSETEPDLSLSPPPLWKRKKVRVIAGVVVAAYVVLMMLPTSNDKYDPNKIKLDALPDVKPWEEVKAAPKALTEEKAPTNPFTPPKTESKPTEVPPADKPVDMEKPPAGPDLRGMLPGRQQEASNKHPAMMSFAVPAYPAKAPPADPTADQTKVLFKGTDFEGAKASPALDDTCMLLPGIMVMQLETAMDSSYPGPFFGHLPFPVFSTKRVKLMEAGTRIVGQYTSMSNNGVTRLNASSTVAYTPNNVIVPLVGIASSDDGKAGIPGWVDEHYPERFGAALMLTGAESATSILQSLVSKGGNSYLQLNSGSSGGVGSLAQDILRAQSTIARTFHKNPGETIGILIDHIISFKDSYKIAGKSCS